MYYLVITAIFIILLFNVPLGVLLLVLALAFYYFSS